jgi:hypothetical protein
MNHLKKTFTLSMLLTLIISSRTIAQDSFRFASATEVMQQMRAKQRAREIMQDNEYVSTGYEKGTFLVNPLMLNGEPLDYSIFGLRSKGRIDVS